MSEKVFFARNPIFVHEVPECWFFHNGKGLTGLDDKESCLELVESIRRHTILTSLRFLSVRLRLVFRRRGLLAMFHFLLQLVSIFQVLVPRRRVLLGDVIASHTLSGAYPDRRVCVRSRMIGLKLFVDVINQSEITPIR